MVLAGGPDRERPVSLQSGRAVAQALQQAGHNVQMRDIGPDNLTALADWPRWSESEPPSKDDFERQSGGKSGGQSGGAVVFPLLHGRWGEGGALQKLLDERAIPYVGSTQQASQRCMDKHVTKQLLVHHGLPTPAFGLLAPGQPLAMSPPLVIKPCLEGSSIDVLICLDPAQARAGQQRFAAYDGPVLVERYIHGKELTVGIVAGPDGDVALPPIQIDDSTVAP